MAEALSRLRQDDPQARLEAENEALRAANRALEARIHDSFASMDAMLREVEASRQESEAKRRQLESLAGLVLRITDTIHDILLVAGPDGRVSRASRSACAFFGVGPEHLLGRDVDSLLAEEDLARLKARLRASPWSGRPVLYELIYQDDGFEAEVALSPLADGSGPCEAHHLLHGGMLYDPAGKEEGIVLLFSDISAVKQREQMARERDMERSLGLMRAIIANVDQGIVMFDRALEVVVWNRRYLELLDLPEGLIRTGMPIEAVFRFNAERGEYGPGDIDALVEARMAQIRTWQPHRYERERPNGAVVEVYGRPLADGGLITTYTDITERRRRAEELERKVAERTREVRQSEERFRHLAESASDWFWETDERLRYSYFSDRFYAVTGIEPANVLGRTRREMAGGDVTAEPEKWRRHFDDLDHHRPFRDLHYPLPLPGGREPIHIRVNGLPYFDEDGRFLGYRGTGADITELVAAQQELARAEKLASLGGLVAGVAHEINTPLGTGLTAASHLGERLAAFGQAYAEGRARKSDLEGLLAGAGELSALITGNLRRAAELVRSFKLIAVDQSSDARRRFELKGYLDEVLQSLKPQFRHRPIAVTIRCPDGLILDSHPGAVSQILTNLLLNSLIHAFDDDTEGRIDIRAEVTDNALLLTYGDNGRGMSEAVCERIFDPFFTTRRGQGGSGLGMHIVYNLVTQTLGGQIECRSTSGQGMAVVMRLPMREARDDG